MFPIKRVSFFAFLGFAALVLLYPLLAAASGDFTETSVVNNAYDQINPAISGNRVVWQDYRNKTSGCPAAQNCLSADVYEKDLVSGDEQRLTTTTNGLDPDISGSQVVWRNWTTGKIMVHDLTSGNQNTASSATGTVQEVSPAISGNIVVWIDYRVSASYGEVYMRDLSQPADQVVAAGNPALQIPQRDKRNPDIDGNIVAWEDWRNASQDAQGWWHNPDIYAKDLFTETEYAVCTNASDQYSPVVSGTRVFWQDYRNGNWDIYMKDLATGVETRLTTNRSDQSWPSASGDYVVWKDQRNGDEDVFIKRISTGIEWQVSSDPTSNPSAAQKMPVISGNNIAWTDKRSGNWDIYSAKDTVAPQVGSIIPSGLIKVAPTTISAAFTDSGMGVDQASVEVYLDGGVLPGCTTSDTSVSCTVTGLTEGTHATIVTVSDLAGNPATGSASFTIDTVAPQIGNLQPDGWVKSASPVVSADLSDIGSGINTATASVALDGAPLSGCTITSSSVSCPVLGLAEGDHTFSVSATDLAGNQASAPGSFTVDSQAPVVTSVQPSGLIESQPSAVTISFSDPAPSSGINTAAVSVYLDGATLSGCTVGATGASCAVYGLGFGVHTISGQVPDNAGNSAPASGSFTISTCTVGKPNLSLASPSAFWASYADYTIRKLGVIWTINNTGGTKAYGVAITSSSATYTQITTITSMPAAVGTINAGGSGSVTVQYTLPSGFTGSGFRVINSATASDCGGTGYTYPTVPGNLVAGDTN